MKEPKYHWQYGLLSGYSPCCIAWFYIRSYAYIQSGAINWKIFKKFKAALHKNKFQHVVCPIHSAAHLMGLYPVIYFTCQECGWHQYGQSTACAVAEGHEGWVRARLEGYYSQIKVGSPYWKLKGEIAKEIRQKAGLED